jgi:glycosyltransferase involved in cell wall biosynthesis
VSGAGFAGRGEPTPGASATPQARVAVVIPCLDDGALVADAVRSVREPEPVELVVVDDGSTDPASLAELERVREAGVRVIARANGGPGAARMTGVEATAAPYVFPLDADDLLEPGALTALADVLERRPEAGFAWGDYLLFGDQQGTYRAPSAFLPWSLTYVNQYPICSLLRRSALLEVGGYPDRGYEDWSLWLKFAERGYDGAHAGRVVYRRRLHGSGRAGPDDRRRHEALYTRLLERHPGVFAARAVLRRRERPALWKRAAYPLLFGRRSVLPFAVEAWLQRLMMRFGIRLSR